jgi:NTP pyrophosphatase (non-canonical NTP hydrolase)
MRKDEILVVLKPPRATIDVVRVAGRRRWNHRQRILPTERRLYEEIYEVAETGTIVRVIDDHFMQIIFVALQGNGRDVVESVLRKEIETLDDAAIEALLRSEKPKDRATGIRVLAAIAPDTAEPKIVKAFAKAAKDPALEVFQALVEAVGRAAWPELWPVLDELVKTGKAEAEDLKNAARAHITRP